jgi:hypothetical protein
MLVETQNQKGEFRQQLLDEPALVLPGDVVRVIGNQIVITRGNVVVGTRQLIGESEPVAGLNEAETVYRAIFWRAKPVPGINQVLTEVRKSATTGIITIFFSNGESREYADFETMRAAVEYLDTNNETAQDALVLRLVRRSPEGTDLENQVGSSCSINFDAAVPIVITEAA